MAEVPLSPPANSDPDHATCTEREKKETSTVSRPWHLRSRASEWIQRRYDSISEAQVDEGLEQLRQINQRLPALVQIVANCLAAVFVFSFYSWAYYRSRTPSNKLKKRERLPLMTEAVSGVRQDDNAETGRGEGVTTLENENEGPNSLRKTHGQLRELLFQHGLLASPSNAKYMPSSPSVPARHLADATDAVLPSIVNEEEWVREIRGDSSLRRLVSRLMQHEDRARQLDRDLFDRLDLIYDRLVPMPSPQARGKSVRARDNETYLFELSVIVPCHDGEPLDLIRRTIQKLYQHCRNPSQTQLVLVHAVDPPRPEDSIDSSKGVKPQQSSSSSSSPRLYLPSLLRDEKVNRSDQAKDW
jgi:hypothetical protein